MNPSHFDWPAGSYVAVIGGVNFLVSSAEEEASLRAQYEAAQPTPESPEAPADPPQKG